MLQIHASLGTFCVCCLVFPRSHNKRHSGSYSGWVSLKDFYQKYIFTLPVFFDNIIDLGKRIYTDTKETGHVIKNSLILPPQIYSIQNKLALYTILSFTKSNENWRARFQLERKDTRNEWRLFQHAFAWLLFKEPLQATREKVLGL